MSKNIVVIGDVAAWAGRSLRGREKTGSSGVSRKDGLAAEARV
ncbi:hypothetical protein [Rhizobium bangladeshense]|nr:hypothetical protein [Rhizobium bangladeshense]